MSENVAGDLSALLRTRGWKLAESNSRGSDLWSLNGRVEMYLPSEVTRGSFLWSDLVERIADAHEERVTQTEREIELIRFDVTRFRIDGSRTIPLEAGATVIGSAFGMLRAAATAARRPRQSIGSNYSKLGDEIVGEARLAHTEVGSFIFPVALKVSPPEMDPDTPIDTEVFASSMPESPERRVTRTLAQAVSAFDKHVLQPGREPQMRDLTPVIIAGGTREMFSHVSRAISEPGISWLETDFAWASVESISTEIPRAIRIPADAEAQELLTRSVRLLSAPKSEPIRVITGPIITISHAPGDPFGEIAIQVPSLSHSRSGRVEAVVRREQLDQIHHWMNHGTTVVVQGEVERRPGRPARIKEIASPQPLDDALFGNDNEP